MAKLCTSCGNPLPRDDSRFCNNCGAAFTNARSSPIPRRTQVISGDHPSAPARPALREQIAFAAPSQAGSTETPSWMSKLDKMGNRPISRPSVPGRPSTAPPKVENPPSNANRSSATAPSRSPQNELRFKVWEEDELPDIVMPAEQQNGHAEIPQAERKEEQATPQQVERAASQTVAEADSEVEDLPTIPMPSTFLPEKVQHGDKESQADVEDRADADLPTRPLPANLALPKPAPENRPKARPFPAQSYRQTAPPPSLPEQSVDQWRQGLPAQADSYQPPIVQRPVTPALPVSYPGFQQATPSSVPATKARADRPSASRPARRKSKLRLVIVLVMLLVLVAGGLTYWIVTYQPFSVPAVTQTSLAFSNKALGIALRYPQGWTAKLDQAHQTVSFFDANHTYPVTLSETATNGQSIDAFVKKEVAQLGLTAQKNLPPLTFAGTSWQQVQGTILVSGATYTETLLVETHGEHFYALAQMAPATTYADADHLFFSILRSSFQFL
ncbi:MAG: hypothetical protein ACRDIV_17305 [Ktedonobacteraceae bacterium]